MLQQQQHGRENVVSMDKLPPEILRLILSKLPPDSICSCRGVRKSWNEQIQEPFFSKLHCSVSHLAITVVNQTRISDQIYTGFAFVELSRFRGYTVNVTDKVIQMSPFEFSLVGSCNGLTCLTSFDYSSYRRGDHFRLLVCNPMLGTHFFLPDPPCVESTAYGIYEQFGFGYVPSLAQYKFVKTVYVADQRRLVSYVCTVEWGRKKKKITPHPWRETTGIANDVDGLIPELRGLYSRPVFFRGSLIWIGALGNDEKERFCLVYFDVEKELMQTLSLPPDTFKDFSEDVFVGVYYDHEGNDHLYICEEDISCANIWVVEAYECVESSCPRLKWFGRIKWVIPVPERETFHVKLFKVFADGKLLISIHNSKLAHYDPSTGVLETLDGPQFPGIWNELALDTPSLLGCMV